MKFIFYSQKHLSRTDLSQKCTFPRKRYMDFNKQVESWIYIYKNFEKDGMWSVVSGSNNVCNQQTVDRYEASSLCGWQCVVFFTKKLNFSGSWTLLTAPCKWFFDKIEKFLTSTADKFGYGERLTNAPINRDPLDFFSTKSCKPASTFLEHNADLSKACLEALSERTHSRQLVRALMHFSNTVRPDITYTMCFLACFLIHSLKSFRNLESACSDISNRNFDENFLIQARAQSSMLHWFRLESKNYLRNYISGYVFLCVESIFRCGPKMQSFAT